MLVASLCGQIAVGLSCLLDLQHLNGAKLERQWSV